MNTWGLNWEQITGHVHISSFCQSSGLIMNQQHLNLPRLSFTSELNEPNPPLTSWSSAAAFCAPSVVWAAIICLLLKGNGGVCAYVVSLCCCRVKSCCLKVPQQPLTWLSAEFLSAGWTTEATSNKQVTTWDFQGPFSKETTHTQESMRGVWTQLANQG